MFEPVIMVIKHRFWKVMM